MKLSAKISKSNSKETLNLSFLQKGQVGGKKVSKAHHREKVDFQKLAQSQLLNHQGRQNSRAYLMQNPNSAKVLA
jgi:hypothetical protein